MEPGALLRDHKRHGDGRFRIQRLLTTGHNYQIALAQDTSLEDKIVCVKAIGYDDTHTSDPRYIQGRRDALRLEMEFLATTLHLLPEPLDWLELGESPVGDAPEPVLIYDYQHGPTLWEFISKKYPQGMNPNRALRIFSELVRFAGDIHEHGYVFRDFDPRHVVIGPDDVIHVVGCGNAVQKGERLNVFKMNTSPSYTAPEIRRELSGKLVRPACDFYSLGCLLSYMLTGLEPGPLPEAPLEADAYDQLRSQAPDGHRLLIARCLQPLAQKRFARASDLLAYCTPDTLPTPSTDGFSMVALPAPWSGPAGVDNRAVRSKISPGPLISVRNPPEAAPPGAPPVTPPPADPAAPPTPVPEDQALVPVEKAPKEPSDGMFAAMMAFFASLLVSLGLANKEEKPKADPPAKS